MREYKTTADHIKQQLLMRGRKATQATIVRTENS